MSTHAYIGVETEDGTIRAIYNHFDGYVEGVGFDLVNQFSLPREAGGLVEDGDCLNPGNPFKDYPGEDWEIIKPRQHDNFDSFMKGKRQNAGHYAYLFRDNEWYIVVDGELIPVTEKIAQIQKSG